MYCPVAGRGRYPGRVFRLPTPRLPPPKTPTRLRTHNATPLLTIRRSTISPHHSIQAPPIPSTCGSSAPPFIVGGELAHSRRTPQPVELLNSYYNLLATGCLTTPAGDHRPHAYSPHRLDLHQWRLMWNEYERYLLLTDCNTNRNAKVLDARDSASPQPMPPTPSRANTPLLPQRCRPPQSPTSQQTPTCSPALGRAPTPPYNSPSSNSKPIRLDHVPSILPKQSLSSSTVSQAPCPPHPSSSRSSVQSQAPSSDSTPASHHIPNINPSTAAQRKLSKRSSIGSPLPPPLPSTDTTHRVFCPSYGSSTSIPLLPRMTATIRPVIIPSVLDVGNSSSIEVLPPESLHKEHHFARSPFGQKQHRHIKHIQKQQIQAQKQNQLAQQRLKQEGLTRKKIGQRQPLILPHEQQQHEYQQDGYQRDKQPDQQHEKHCEILPTVKQETLSSDRPHNYKVEMYLKQRRFREMYGQSGRSHRRQYTDPEHAHYATTEGSASSTSINGTDTCLSSVTDTSRTDCETIHRLVNAYMGDNMKHDALVETICQRHMTSIS